MSADLVTQLNQAFVLANTLLSQYGLKLELYKIVLKPVEQPNAIHLVYSLTANNPEVINKIRDYYRQQKQ